MEHTFIHFSDKEWTHFVIKIFETISPADPKQCQRKIIHSSVPIDAKLKLPAENHDT